MRRAGGDELAAERRRLVRALVFFLVCLAIFIAVAANGLFH